MSVTMQEMINFHLTGKPGREEFANCIDPDACPALMVPYRQLSALRYDFPLVLLDNPEGPVFADSLTGIMNRLIRDIAPPGNTGEQLRQHILRLEARMRELVAGGLELSLSQLWRRAEQSLVSECEVEEADTLANSLATARFALKVDGRVIDCDERLAMRVLEHASALVNAQRTKQTVAKIEKLIVQLRNILKVDTLKSSSSQTPDRLKKNLGKRYKESFDFELMSELLGDATPKNRLPSARRQRLKAALTELETQRFFVSTTAAVNRRGHGQYQFVVENLGAALKAYNDRLPRMTDLVKAISIAELECDNAYREKNHSQYFDRFTSQALTSEDLSLFPSYLICMSENDCDAGDSVRLMEILSGDLPMKVLLQVSDPIENRLGQIAMAPGTAFLLQSATSNLFRQGRAIRRGLEFEGPAVFSVFVPRDDEQGQRPSYLTAAAAVESRAFPSFSYDPGAGAGLADRFLIDSNPSVDKDWPEREFSYEDEALQTVVEQHAFTTADFAVLLQQYVAHFAFIPKQAWSDDMLPVAEYLQLCDSDTVDKVPFVTVVDGDDVLRRFVVDDQLIRMVRRCRERWHALQELGGVHNSYVSAAMENAARLVPEAEVVAEEAISEEPSQPDAEIVQSAEAVIDEVVEDVQSADTDEPYIDTASCTTCDECTNKNDRMFAYDDNKQAYIKDATAGTYRELVEAAEACQVAIIHPGKPLNPDEPGLEELVARAKPFMV